jgi:hypothetical protein
MREDATADTRKLAASLDDTEVRVVVYGLAHVYPGELTGSDAERLKGAVQRLAGTMVSSTRTPMSVGEIHELRCSPGSAAGRDMIGWWLCHRWVGSARRC